MVNSRKVPFFQCFHNMDIKLIIPARYQSTRLPGKPLVEIAGIPMIQRVYHQCALVMEKDKIFVTTDDTQIETFCKLLDIQVVMTSESCLTGTDRVAEASRILGGDVFINVQGDEPVFNPNDIQILLNAVFEDPTKIYCGYAEIRDEDSYRSLSIPKMIFSQSNRLMYTSRNPIPGNKKGIFLSAKRQICAYAFTPESLDLYFSRGVKTPLEEQEDLELLRFLEMDIPVYGLEMSDISIPVDHPEDILKVEEFLKNA